jgi:hypothetical protein
MSVRVRRGFGGAPGLIVLGAAESNVTYPGLAGIVSYAEPWLQVLPIVLGGPPGQPGGGVMDVGATIPVSLGGTALYLQVGFTDSGAPAAIAVTQGLEILFGI